MLPRLLAATILCAFIAGTSFAENNCGSMLRTISRFRGTIRSVRPLSQGATDVIDADLDAAFAVSIEVDSVAPDTPAPKPGQKLTFGIHSPSRTFRTASELVGQTFDLEAERMECDGTFRRFISLERRWPSPVVEKFDGWLEVGHTYRAATQRSGRDVALAGTLNLPMHHDGGIDFMNADAFANPDMREIVFEVVAVHITQTGERRWLSLFDARIISAH
jgi:hypothetical protein